MLEMTMDSFVQEFPESSNCRLFICVSIRICMINARVMNLHIGTRYWGRVRWKHSASILTPIRPKDAIYPHVVHSTLG